MGSEEFTQKTKDKNTEILIKHQKRRSAIETLFTIALILFASSQLMVTVYSPNPNISDILFLIGTPILTFSVIVLALLIGGENLISVIKKEIFDR